MKTHLNTKTGRDAAYPTGQATNDSLHHSFEESSRPGKFRTPLLVLLAGLAVSSAAQASTTVAAGYGASSGYGISATASLAGLELLNVNEAGKVSGVAPPVYSRSTAAADAEVDRSGGAGLLSVKGTVLATAASNVNGGSGTRTTSASAQVTNLSVNVADLLGPTPPLVAVGADLIGSQSSVSGDGSASTISSSATITNLTVSISGANVTLPVNPPPNTVINAPLGVAGITIYLNEQTPVTGTAGTTVQTTALRVKVTSVTVLGFLGLINSEIKVGATTSTQFADADHDGRADDVDADDDGDGIPDTVEIALAPASGDTDGDGLPNHRDLDSDNDGINDVIEAGGVDANGDGMQDGADGNGNGWVDSTEPARGGTALPLPDTDNDGIKNYLDLDSDNDALSDLVESGHRSLDTDNDGTADGTDDDNDGIVAGVDGSTAFGDANSPSMPDPDSDGIPNLLDPSSLGAGTRDILTSGYQTFDGNGDGKVDNITDSDHDGVADVVDWMTGTFGGLGDPLNDSDHDGATDIDEGSGQVDTDGDGIPDSRDSDSDADGIPDSTEIANAPSNGDTDGDGIVDRRDLDSDNDGLNDVIEGGGTDANGDARQDGSADVDQDGLVDTVDTTQGGTALPVPDSDGDGVKDYLDLDSDNDTVADLLEGGSGAPDTNHDGIVDGGDGDGDGIRDETDLLIGFGDAQDKGAVNTDGTDKPDYIDPDSDNNGSPDINATPNKNLDVNGDGKVDGPYVDPDKDGVDARVDTKPTEFGGTGGCTTSGAQWKKAHFTATELANAQISGWAADPDSDGMSNALEYAFGTDPKVASSQVELLPVFTGGTTPTLKITVPRDTCVRAFLNAEYSTDLAAWTSSGPGISYLLDSPSSMIVSISGSAVGAENRLFVRLKVTVP